jgi:tetratricopeptide (TPR) repeat protein
MKKPQLALPTAFAASAVLVLSYALFPLPARAASQQSLEKAARKACLIGDYEKGVSILSDLFIESKDPTYIFNQARCFEQNRRYEEAIARFQEYLRAAPRLRAADKDLTEKHIADCQHILDKQQARTSPPAPAPLPEPVPTPAPPALAVPTPTATVVEPAEHVQPVVKPGAGAGLRTAGIVSASVGAAALIAGVVLNLKVNSMARDLERLGEYSDGKESDRKTYETLGWIGYATGAACLTTGAILYYLGARSRRSASTVALVPILAPDRSGVALGGRF